MRGSLFHSNRQRIHPLLWSWASGLAFLGPSFFICTTVRMQRKQNVQQPRPGREWFILCPLKSVERFQSGRTGGVFMHFWEDDHFFFSIFGWVPQGRRWIISSSSKCQSCQRCPCSQLPSETEVQRPGVRGKGPPGQNEFSCLFQAPRMI